MDWCFPAFSLSSHYGILMQDAMLSGLVFPSLLLILTLWNSYAGCYVEWTGVSQPSPYPHTMEFLCRMLCCVDWCFPAFSLSSHYGILMQDAMLSGLVFPSLLLILTLWNSYAGCYVVWTEIYVYKGSSSPYSPK